VGVGVKDWADSIGFYNAEKPGPKRVMTYGDTGVGKTLFAASWPKPFFIDTDRGGATLEGTGIPYLSLTRGDKVFDVCMDVIRKLREKKAPFDKLEVETLVIDSFTNLGEDLLIEAMRFPPPGMNSKDPNSAKPEWDHYAILASRMKNIVMEARETGCHNILICATKLEKDDVRGNFEGKPNIVGGYRDLIGYDFDYVFYQTAEGVKDKKKFMLYTAKNSYFAAKARSPKGKPLDYAYENPTFSSIWKE
jgi:hypothetical protein